MAEMNKAKETLEKLCGGMGFQHNPQPFSSASDILDYNNAAQKYWEGRKAFESWHPVANKPPSVGTDAFASGLRSGAKSLSMDQLRGRPVAGAEGCQGCLSCAAAELDDRAMASRL